MINSMNYFKTILSGVSIIVIIVSLYIIMKPKRYIFKEDPTINVIIIDRVEDTIYYSTSKDKFIFTDQIDTFKVYFNQ